MHCPLCYEEAGAYCSRWLRLPPSRALSRAWSPLWQHGRRRWPDVPDGRTPHCTAKRRAAVRHAVE